MLKLIVEIYEEWEKNRMFRDSTTPEQWNAHKYFLEIIDVVKEHEQTCNIHNN